MKRLKNVEVSIALSNVLRRLLGDAALTPPEVETIRDAIRLLAKPPKVEYRDPPEPQHCGGTMCNCITGCHCGCSMCNP